MPKTILDVEKLRRRDPNDVMEGFDKHQEVLDNLLSSAEKPPITDWVIPKSISELTAEELSDSLHVASLMHGHYKALQIAAEQLQKGIEKAMVVLAASLRQNVYFRLSKEEQKDAVILDKQYNQAGKIGESLSYFLANVQGEASRWYSLMTSFSRDFERRKNDVPRKPTKRYPEPPAWVGKKHE